MDADRIENLLPLCRDYARQTLGWLLTNPDAWDEAIRPELFFDHAHRETFRAIARMRERGETRTPAGVIAELRNHAEPTARDWTIVVENLLDGAAFPGHHSYAIAKLIAFARRWKAIESYDRIGDLLADPTIDIDDIEQLTGVSGIVPLQLTAATSN